ncbi:hypothetical protein JTB14_038275 [Gonioctena quinquepunctata]|nr:hypothetical protein JTB14_038275 [Gonioctena quinquepunctata]
MSKESKVPNPLDRTHRHSLQPKNLHDNGKPPSSLRHTQSHRYDSDGKTKSKKTVVLTPIPSATSENSEEDAVVVDEKTQKVKAKLDNGGGVRKGSSTSKTAGYDNLAYDGNLDRRSVGSSRAGSSRQPSLQSLEVVREQYCWCAKRTKCERRLIITVTILSITIIVLVIVIAVITTNHDIKEGLRIKLKL